MSVSVTQQRCFSWAASSWTRRRRDDGGPEPGDRRGHRRGAAGNGGGRERRSTLRERRGAKWQGKTPKDRMELSSRSRTASTSTREELARLESQNVGKPWWVAVDEPARCRTACGSSPALPEPRGEGGHRVRRGLTSMIRREPLGIVAGICRGTTRCTWRSGRSTALAAGNVQIIKPAGRRRSPCSASWSSRRSHPSGGLQVVTGDGIPSAMPSCAPRTSALVSLTGDHGDGKDLAKNARDTVKRVHPRARRQGPDGRPRHADTRPLQRRLKIGGYFNSGQDARPRRASSSVARSTRRGVRDREGRRVAERRRPVHGRRDRDGTGHLRRSAGARTRLPRARDGCEGDDRDRRRVARRARMLREADDRHRCRSERRDRPDEVFGPVV